jgi:hypothetical protein
LIKGPHCRLQDQWSHSIVGLEGAQSLKFQRRATIRTMVLRRGQVVARGELRGQNQFVSKPLLDAPTITCLCEVISPGHIYEGDK